MISLQRVFHVFKARNLEFFRDKGSLVWNIIFPLFLVAAIGLAASGPSKGLFQVAVVTDAESAVSLNELEAIDYLFFNSSETGEAMLGLQSHRFDALINFSDNGAVFYNPQSEKGVFVQSYLTDKLPDLNLEAIAMPLRPYRYVEWVLPGIVAMNILFSALWGVGYIVIRYRKNGYLRRLSATPLTALEFIMGQMFSRVLLTTVIGTALLVSVWYFLPERTHVHWGAVFGLLFTGSLMASSLGLLICSRTQSEELGKGLLEMVAWPLIILGGVWFSPESLNPLLTKFGEWMPLTPFVEGLRNLILYGALLEDVTTNMIYLSLVAVGCLLTGALCFKWYEQR